MNWNPSGNGAATESLPLYKVLRLGDLAFEGNRTKGHPYGKLVINDIGAGIMSSRFRTLAARRKVCISFWKYLLLNDGALKPIYIKCTKRGTLMTELVVPELLESELLLPSDAEQRLIGSYFSRLDDLITLHQREYPAFVHPKTERAKEIETAVTKVPTSFWLEVSYLALVPNVSSS